MALLRSSSAQVLIWVDFSILLYIGVVKILVIWFVEELNGFWKVINGHVIFLEFHVDYAHVIEVVLGMCLVALLVDKIVSGDFVFSSQAWQFWWVWRGLPPEMASFSSIQRVLTHLWIALRLTKDHAFKCVSIPRCWATAGRLISSLNEIKSLLKFPLWSKALEMNVSPSRVEFPDCKKLNIALYELSIIDSSYRFTVFGDTAFLLIEAPMMMQKLFLLMILSSNTS